MGLFKDFKEDFSQAVNEMIPGGDMPETEENVDNLVVDTLGEDVDVKSELSKLDGLLEQVKEEKVEKVAPVKDEIPVKKEEKLVMDTPVVETPVKETTPVETTPVVDETSVITASTTLSGDISSAGSLDIQGTINGNVTCNGKLVVTGTINGNSSSSEFFADVAKIEGEVASSGTVKVGAGSVIIGNISATSAVIAGAVKGDIDVQGPVVIDTSAVIMGNIKSRSVQINNGAVIEGFCSQCYADIDVQGLFK
ncbi:MAG: polymer-forming cytoskeletal protein [Agathobacter sp.]|nr:polymer-forming cytoskeletal protein [Agathobacter sp.]